MKRAVALVLATLIGLVTGVLLRDKPTSGSQQDQPPASDGGDDTFEVRRPQPVGGRYVPSDLSESAQTWLAGLREMAADRPMEALSRLKNAPDPEIQPLALAALARGWAQKDVAAAARWVQELERVDDQVSAATGLVPAWCDMDPSACLNWAAALPQGNLREVSLTELADAWAVTSPAEAFDTFVALPAEIGVKRGMHAVICEWAEVDPQAALARISTLQDPDRRANYLEAALVTLTNNDPALAWAYINQMPDFQRGDSVRVTVLEAMAEVRPAEALRLAATKGNPPAFLSAIAKGWWTADPKGATDWVNSLPDETLRAQIVGDLKIPEATGE